MSDQMPLIELPDDLCCVWQRGPQTDGWFHMCYYATRVNCEWYAKHPPYGTPPKTGFVIRRMGELAPDYHEHFPHVEEADDARTV